MLISRWTYYLASIITILRGIRNWPTAMALLLGLPVRRPVLIVLRSGLRFKVRTGMDLWIVKETCLDRDYERVFALRDGWTIVDVGAGFGDFAVAVAHEHPHSVVHAYEPFSESFVLLEKNVILNGVTNVRRYPFAIGARSGPMTLATETGVAVQHSTARAEDQAARTIEVPGRSLTAAFTEAGIARCDLLKVDCEGGEFAIFLDLSPKMLARIDRIAMEYHDDATVHTHETLVRRLEAAGFRVSLRPNPVHCYLGFLYAEREGPR